MKLRKMSREEYKAALDRGEKFTPAYLYEQLHAPKGTEFVLVDFGKGLTRIMRKRGPEGR